MARKVKPDSADGETLAAEAWGLLIPLVYPPRFIEIAHNLGVTPPILGALRFLEHPQTMGRMAELLHCDPSNVTGIVDALEERNLAERKPSEVDRRVKVVELTVAGKKLRARASEEMYKAPAWIEGLSAADQRKLRDILKRAGGNVAG
ncbi:MAG TPA: MarR family transcriptional regulator [Solirubrobacterales bacterium]|jgi:DNA-binding MarR family transcriptional regulator|nr:MarR family transcriptional regulator [Solirubrobacterales bacterium]